ncbi:pyridoxamine 5'-phosphate oxidase family protein [Methylorubrum rhodesianum]|uniref:pyridoxamine 5'-phosphate oxidase family protein n=1 Tax=Methylorubrum rhodesianum TaxID=29427 RepID=UPI003CFDDD3D
MPAADNKGEARAPRRDWGIGEVLYEQASFIEQSSLIFLLSSSPNSAPDVSPRGDSPGFVKLSGRNVLQLPDRIGNNRLDTMQNLLVNPCVVAVFTRRGDERALIVSGYARISVDPELLSKFEYNGKPPRSVMEIEVEDAKFQESSAFAASGFWLADGSDRDCSVASLGEILSDQVGGMTKDEGEAFIANSYTNKLY